MRTFEPVRYITIGGKKLPQDISNDVISFSYEDISDKMDELRLTIRDEELKHMDNPLLQEGKEICARWGYLGHLCDVRQCTIKEIEYDFPEDGCPTLTLVAYDKGHKLTGRSARTCWNGKKVAEIVKDIAAKHGLKPTIEIPEDVPREYTSQGGKNDMEFLEQLASETGCRLQVKNDRLIFAPEKETGPTLAFEYRKDQDGWLKSLKVSTDTEKGKGAAAKTEVSGVNPNTGKEFKQDGNAAESGYSLNLNNSAVQETKLQVRHDEAGKSVASTAADAAGAKAVAKSKARNAVKGNIKMAAEFIGMPYLASNNVVTITGIGKKLSGNWKVHSVLHTITADNGYTCQADLTKNDVSKASGNGGKTQSGGNGGGGNKNGDNTIRVDLRPGEIVK